MTTASMIGQAASNEKSREGESYTEKTTGLVSRLVTSI